MQRALIALGERIRELREEKHWSQEEFADRCGLHRTAIGLLERAERNPRLDTLLTVSKGFGITVSDLLRDVEKRSQSSGGKAVRSHL
jgi:transcriptional regulator with XRE-family HTH domain